ncbi:transmembrane emp24 domain-containing protein p24delta3-like isoform X1 [Dendrobium catenatum]|uniref:transmembrane emp24 domain-containing protein p24delta3-like isoform X1 n=1 Tax=Dendrobium catenatum TaxID=906689 RepID=UPI00109F7456|nr:transmembrane emp24 domain-containing protein p24delta3-like isoform X1 [Dendrobium catenatum]
MSSRDLSLRRSDAWILLLLPIRLVDAWNRAIWINLPAGGTKCVSEEIQPNVVVLADYSVVPEDSSHEHPTISAKIDNFWIFFTVF